MYEGWVITHSIAKLEAQLGQVTNNINRREERKLPDQTVANPKGQYGTKGSNGNGKHHEQRELEPRPVTSDVTRAKKGDHGGTPNENKSEEETPKGDDLVPKDPLEACLAHFGFDNFDINGLIKKVNALLNFFSTPDFPPWKARFKSLHSLSRELVIPSLVIPLTLELKPLPIILKYAFLGPNDTLPVIIASDLIAEQEIDRRSAFSQIIKKAKDLAFLEKEDGVALLEVIGSGGCGVVYKAELPGSNGKLIAIKKIIQPPKDAGDLMDEDSKFLATKMRQIKSEIQAVGQIRRRNLLPLLAHVLQDILNQVSNGTRQLDWQARHKIAIGVASGLEYLHTSHSPRIIHRDLKPANVLLDDDMEARIADFGLAKAVPDAHTHVTTSNVTGTVGYIAPEYHQTLMLCLVGKFWEGFGKENGKGV
ncbi:hypothetical protein CsSME_00007052 [Camellia sinensis var. sinensis]